MIKNQNLSEMKREELQSAEISINAKFFSIVKIQVFSKERGKWGY